MPHVDAAFDLAEACQVLGATPAVLRAWLAPLGPGWVEAREGEGTWSPHDVVRHLIHGEREDWIPRTRWILAGRREPFPPFDREAPRRAGASTPLAEDLDTFERLRAGNLATLAALGLTAADLDKTGVHPRLGPVTLRHLLATWTVHDLGHLRQVARTLAHRWRGAVGPWNHPDFLGVLHDRGGP